MKVLLVLTSHDKLGDTGRKTGFWLEELAAPYYEFKDAGAQITLASPKGGRPPLDPKSQDPSFQTDITRRFEKDADAEGQLDKTVRLDISSASVSAIKAGFSEPSTSSVFWVFMMTCPPSFGSTPARVTRSRTRAPAGTGARKRTLSIP